MCGQYAITTAPDTIRQWFRTAGPVPNFGATYNAAPGQELPVVRRHPKTGERALGLLRWGLIPHWSNDPNIAWKTIKARGETVMTTPSFRDAYGAYGRTICWPCAACGSPSDRHPL
jgi:putative SOS response-associated peptidase YedK